MRPQPTPEAFPDAAPYASIVPTPAVCPECGARDARWRFEGARSLTDPKFLLRGAWVHRVGMQAHAVVWTPEQVAAVRASENHG